MNERKIDRVSWSRSATGTRRRLVWWAVAYASERPAAVFPISSPDAMLKRVASARRLFPFVATYNTTHDSDAFLAASILIAQAFPRPLYRSSPSRCRPAAQRSRLYRAETRTAAAWALRFGLRGPFCAMPLCSYVRLRW